MEKELLEKALRSILESAHITPEGSKQLIEERLRALIAQPNIRKMLELPSRAQTYLAGGRGELEGRTGDDEAIICTALGIAGWAAWTAADRIRDGDDSDTRKDGADDAYVYSALRPIVSELMSKLALGEKHAGEIAHIMGMMEYANSAQCALSVRKRSGWKSMGAAAPLMALMMKAGAPDHDVARCQDFFYDLILARQLSDDALDWREDAGGGSGRTSRDTLIIRWLEDAFERQVRYQAAREIRRRSRRAMLAARSISCFSDTAFLERLARYYEDMAGDILAEEKIGPGENV